jgi:hypothetical protein
MHKATHPELRRGPCDKTVTSFRNEMHVAREEGQGSRSLTAQRRGLLTVMQI